MFRRSRGVARTMGRTAIIAGTATAASGAVARRQNERDAAAAPAGPEAAGPDAAAPDAVAAPAGDDTSTVIEQLKQLAELKDQGILTEEEFAVQKAKVLGP